MHLYYLALAIGLSFDFPAVLLADSLCSLDETPPAFYLEDTLPPSLNCKPFFATNTWPLLPGTDADGDGHIDRGVWFFQVEDLLMSTPSDSLQEVTPGGNELSEFWQYSINIPGESFDSIRTQFLWTCSNSPILDTLEVRAWDEAGNYSNCLIPFAARDTREDCGHCHPVNNITGWVRTEEGVGVPKVGLKFRNITWNDATWLDGYYKGCGQDDNAVTVAPFKHGDLLEGVSTVDLILLRRIVLALDSSTSPYKLLAADVNNDQRVSTLDIVELQRAILGISDSFSNNTAWRFVAESYNFPRPNNPWWEDFPTTLDFSITQYGKPGNFIAIKIGDLNGSALSGD